MDTSKIVNDLRAERDRIDQAIAALESLDSVQPIPARRGRPPATASQPAATTGRGGKRKLSAAARRRISEASKRRWARQKAQKTTAKALVNTASKLTAPKRGMSPAARKRMSEMMKKRWAARKKAAAAKA